MGLFGVAGRDNSKILNKQNQLLGPGIANLFSTLKKNFALSGNAWTHDAEFVDLFAQTDLYFRLPDVILLCIIYL